MKVLLFLSAILAILLCFTQCKKENDRCGEMVPGEIMFQSVDTVNEQTVHDLTDSLGLTIKDHFGETYYLVGVPTTKEQFWVDELKNYPIIKGAQLNHYVCIN